MNNAKEKAQDRKEEILMKQPLVIERFADNGEHSHWDLIDAETGETLWSEEVPFELKKLETYAREKAIEELENLKQQAEFFIPKAAEPPISEWARGKLGTHLNLVKYLTERIAELKKPVEK